MEFVLASNNKSKIAELRTVFADELPQIKLLSLSEAGIFDEIVEDGQTFEENSIIKASAPVKLGYAGIADDSGLCVEALNGAPGVYSARYSGFGVEANNDKLLAELYGVENRAAKFVCVMSAVFPDGRIVTARGEVNGVILKERRGENGFGYDPLFYCPELCKTFAEAQAEEKNRISHRAKAIKLLCEKLKEVL